MKGKCLVASLPVLLMYGNLLCCVDLSSIASCNALMP